MTLKEFTDLMCTNVEMSIELRDTDNQEICTCKSGSKGIKPYEDCNVNEWFTNLNNGRVVVTISTAHIFVKGPFEDSNLGKIMLLCDNKYEELKPKVDWSKVPIDTPILVRDYKDGRWKKRYFAGYIGEKICTFDDGRTSEYFSRISSWQYAKLAENES